MTFGPERKKPDVAVTPGFGGFSEYGQASQAQNLGGERRFILETGRLIGITPCTQGFAYET